MGASTALACADRGHAVTVHDPHQVSHGLGSSHGRSRIVRRAYPDPFYTEIMQVAYPMWQDLHRRAREPVLFESGLLYFGGADSTNLKDVAESLVQNGVPHEVLTAGDSNRRFPSIRLAPHEAAIWTEEAGWVHAEHAVRACLTLAGVEPVARRVDPRELLAEFDRVLVCAGAWTSKWFPLEATVTRQTFAYVGLQAPQEGPVWIEDSDDFLYGFPSEPGLASVKVGVHTPGPVQDPDESDRTPGARELALIEDFAKRRFRGATGIRSAHGCLYTSTNNEDFRFGCEGDRLFWASPCSGHGFKFGPWVGKLMADFAEGKDHPSNWPRFCV